MSGLQWALVKGEKGDPSTNSLKKNREYYFSNGSSSTTDATTTSSSRAIPRGNKNPPNHEDRYSSAPIQVPDRSKVYGYRRANAEDYKKDDVDDDNDDDADEMIPPHDYIAKKLSKANISSFSMCEGNGRTLKGRDLRKVRNEVLTKTGFLE